MEDVAACEIGVDDRLCEIGVDDWLCTYINTYYFTSYFSHAMPCPSIVSMANAI